MLLLPPPYAADCAQRLEPAQFPALFKGGNLDPSVFAQLVAAVHALGPAHQPWQQALLTHLAAVRRLDTAVMVLGAAEKALLQSVVHRASAGADPAAVARWVAAYKVAPPPPL